MAPTQLNAVSDIRFFRFMGAALVVGTLVAGAMMLTLTVGESRAIYLAQEAHTKVPLQLVASSVENIAPTE